MTQQPSIKGHVEDLTAQTINIGPVYVCEERENHFQTHTYFKTPNFSQGDAIIMHLQKKGLISFGFFLNF